MKKTTYYLLSNMLQDIKSISCVKLKHDVESGDIISKLEIEE